MKMTNTCKLLAALGVFHYAVWGTAAFVSQVPKVGMPALGYRSRRGRGRRYEYDTDYELEERERVLEERERDLEEREMEMRDRDIEREIDMDRFDRRGGDIVYDGPRRGRSTVGRDLGFSSGRGPYARQGKDLRGPRREVVQGGSLKTWSFDTDVVDSVRVLLESEGRPLDADIELWQGPDNTPHKMRIYSEDGFMRPFCAVLDTPGSPNTITVRNNGMLEFPLDAYVTEDSIATGSVGGETAAIAYDMVSYPETIQGGALRTFDFDSTVDSVQVLLESDGRPLNARIELLQGPNNKKQVVELYTDDGNYRPFYMIVETPGSGNVVRIVNSATMEFPLYARVEPYSFTEYEYGTGRGRRGRVGPYSRRNGY